MKNKVVLSSYSAVISGMFIILVALSIYTFTRNDRMVETIAIIVAGLTIFSGAMWYAPLSIRLQNGILSVHRLLRTKKFPVADIESVELCPPTMATRRIVGSGGFMGYWGWFKERDLGKYFAYYGKASDCFLVTLKNGKKYMLGCKNAPTMVEALKKGIS